MARYQSVRWLVPDNSIVGGWETDRSTSICSQGTEGGLTLNQYLAAVKMYISQVFVATATALPPELPPAERGSLACE